MTHYKLLEGKPVQSLGWADVEAAHRAIVHAYTAYMRP